MSRTLAILALAALIAGASVAGCLVGRATHRPPSAETAAPAPAPAREVFTCSMHPQVRLDRPGKCPICEMPLIPADAAPSGVDGAPTLQLSDHALAMASVVTTPVTRRELTRELLAVGKVEYDESSLATVTARVDGYAERLFVNFTGVEIEAGHHLAEVYSPDLLVAQQELLIALQGGRDGPLVETSKLKLLRFGLTEEQIEALVANQEMTDRVTLYSPIAGTVIEKSIEQNSAFEAGDALYRVANLDTVWVYLDIYEYDLAWIRYGQEVEIRAEALPGRAFTGVVTFVEPIVNELTRTVRVPVHVENEDHELKPGMFVSAVVRSILASDGTAAPTGVEGQFTCPMHPQVLLAEAGACPLCEMPLERIPHAAPLAEMDEAHEAHGPTGPDDAPTAYACPMECEGEKTYPEPGNCPVCNMTLHPVAPAAESPAGPGVLAVPITAVLDSGTRRIVYVERSRGLFEAREVVVGPRAGEFFPVLEGLAEGERVVTRGGFLIDSQFQITGLPSLFYPGGLMAGSGAHAHGEGSAPDAPAEPEAPLERPADETPHDH